jgi:hypothetical protein
MNIPSILRHWFTLAATAATAWVIAVLALDPDQQAELGKAFGDLVGPLVIIGTLIITAAWRIALTWAGNTFRRGAGETEENNGGPSGGMGLLCLMTCTAAAFGALPSCSLGEYPVRLGIEGDGYSADYSAKDGLSIRATVTDRRYRSHK